VLVGMQMALGMTAGPLAKQVAIGMTAGPLAMQVAVMLVAQDSLLPSDHAQQHALCALQPLPLHQYLSGSPYPALQPASSWPHQDGSTLRNTQVGAAEHWRRGPYHSS